MLERVADVPLSPPAAKQLAYFQNWEQFVLEFFESHSAWEQAVNLQKGGELSRARDALRECRPRAVLEQYSRLISILGATPGEKGLLISMNLRWLPYLISARQLLGLESVRVKFTPTLPEPLAQSPGRFTYFFDSNRDLWMGMGQGETGGVTFARSETPEAMGDAGLRIHKPLALRIACIMGQPLMPAVYTANLLFAAPPTTAGGTLVELALTGSGEKGPVEKRVEIRRKAEGQGELVPVNQQLEIRQGYLGIDINPLQGEALLCGVVLEPMGEAIP
jgi:hypothetical protein